jgi:hypothetical protein
VIEPLTLANLRIAAMRESLDRVGRFDPAHPLEAAPGRTDFAGLLLTRTPLLYHMPSQQGRTRRFRPA